MSRAAGGAWKWIRKERARVVAFLWALSSVAVFAALLGLTLFLTSGPEFSEREDGLLQLIFLAVGIFYSFVAGRRSARAAAADPSGRKAGRQLEPSGVWSLVSMALASPSMVSESRSELSQPKAKT
jgi:hypothetical protein